MAVLVIWIAHGSEYGDPFHHSHVPAARNYAWKCAAQKPIKRHQRITITPLGIPVTCRRKRSEPG